jgi:ABC-type glycerol-3-phosphate transport system substrate-binding protein
MRGMDARLSFNSPLHVRHIENLANMAKNGLFVYKGRGNAADATFVSGECAMVTGSSALYGNVKRNAKFASGIGALPYYPDVPGAPQNTVIGGASLWVMSGKKEADYKGVAQFFAFLSRPEEAAKSHQRTGYLPLTKASYELTEKSNFYKQNPGTDVSVDPDDSQNHRQVARHPPGQLRADPHHQRRRTRTGLGRQEECQRSPGHRHQTRQRATGALRKGQQVLTELLACAPTHARFSPTLSC